MYELLSVYPISLQQSVNAWLLSTKTLVKLHWCICSSPLQYLVSEAQGCIMIKDTILQEEAEGIGIQHFRPFVTVITC